MSSDQQSNAQLNTQPEWDQSIDANSTECYTHINDAATDDGLEGNEIFNECQIEHCQYTKGDDILSLDEVNVLKNVLNAEVNQPNVNNASPENIESSQHAIDAEFKLDKPEDGNQFSEIIDSTEGFEIQFDADGVLVDSRRIQDTLGDKNDFPSHSNTETSVTTDVEQNVRENADLQRQESTVFDQINSLHNTSDGPIDTIYNDHQKDLSNEHKCATSDENVTANEEELEKCDKSTEIDETECAEEDAVDELDKSVDDLTDETELLSNEQDFDDESGEYPSIDVVDFDGTNEVENDEYILDTIVKKPRKERRRIFLVNDDDSDAEMDVEREQLSKSPMIDENVINEAVDAEEDVDIELLIRNEKPGPKSKKMSTQKLKELQARALLRNAVVIPSLNCKKKKSRIIDSDDDDEDHSLLPYSVDVDDIGLPDVIVEDEGSNAIESNSILINYVDKNDEIPKPGATSSSSENQLYSTQNKFKTESPTITTSQQSQHVDVSTESNDQLKEVTIDVREATTVKQGSGNAIVKEEATIVTRDCEESSDSTNQQYLTTEEIATTNFPPFPTSSSSEVEDEFIPNDVYFGTPDAGNKKRARGKGRPRGRPAQSSPRGTSIPQNGIRKSERGRGTSRRRGQSKIIDNRRRSSSDSVSTSSSMETDDEYQKSKAKRKSHTITIVKSPLQLYHNANPPTRPIQQQQIQRQRRKRDRFYDKSRDIPNAIYFGDVDVPLHVLHSYGGDSDSDNDNNKTNERPKNADIKFDPLKANTIRFSSQVSRGQGRVISKNSGLGQKNYEAHNRYLTPSYSNDSKVRGRPKTNSVSPSNDRSIQMMKKFFKAAGLKKVKLNRLWEGCKSNSERAAKMLELLREKGLEGEPTISKCKQLKIEYLTKKEIEDLDPNLIIQTEGRTRRSCRAATKRKYTYDEEEILETRTKLRNVIDSDSDFD